MKRKGTRIYKRPFYYSWYFLIPLACILLLFVRSAYSAFIKKQDAQLEREKYEERLKILQEKKSDLEHKINILETERGKEAEFRTRFDIAKEGETIIRIIEEE